MSGQPQLKSGLEASTRPLIGRGRRLCGMTNTMDLALPNRAGGASAQTTQHASMFRRSVRSLVRMVSHIHHIQYLTLSL